MRRTWTMYSKKTMPGYKRTTAVLCCCFLLTVIALTMTAGCHKEEETKPPAGGSYYTGDDFKGNTGKKMQGVGPGNDPVQGKQ
jgi:preprotein translocase subunit SecG